MQRHAPLDFHGRGDACSQSTRRPERQPIDALFRQHDADYEEIDGFE